MYSHAVTLAGSLAETRPDLAARLGVATGIWRIQERVSSGPVTIPVDPATASEWIAEKRPLLSLASPSIPAEELHTVLDMIVSLLGEADSVNESARIALKESVGRLRPTQGAIDAALASPDGFPLEELERLGASEDGPLTPAALAFALDAALTPFRAAVARTIESTTGSDWSGWNESPCPVCGCAPALGRIAGGGELQGARRTLFCSSCHTEWEFDRVRCARCGTRDALKLRYLFDEADPGRRVHACEECRSYLPVTDERELGMATSPLVETMILDHAERIASHSGY